MIGFLLLVLAVLFLHFVGERRRDLRFPARVYLLVILVLMSLDHHHQSSPVEVKPFESPAVHTLAMEILESRKHGT